MSEPEALDDLVDRLDGNWHTQLADPDGRGNRVGVLSRLALTEVTQVRDFPDRLGPVQVDEDATTISQSGRPALRVPVRAADTDIDVVSAH